MTRLQRRPLPGFLADPLGTAPRAIELNGETLHITHRGKPASKPLRSLTSAPSLRRGILGTALTLRFGNSESVTLKGAARRSANEFSRQVKEAWIDLHLALLEQESTRLSRILAGVLPLAAPSAYPAACLLAPLLEDARSLEASLLAKITKIARQAPTAIDAETLAHIAQIREFVDRPRILRGYGVEAFVTMELERWKDFFDTVESQPLTPEQRLSVVVDEDATLVLAGAGSGKTSVITAKAAYLVKAGIRKPDEILLLAFARNAAQEMSERVEARSGVPIAAQTFHALAYHIIGQVEGSKPALAAHANDDMAFVNLIKEILTELVHRLAEVAKAIIEFFTVFFVEPKTEWDFQTRHDYYSHLENQDMRTLQGEQVKSHEELRIANWLYKNGVEYEYEPTYEHKVSEPGRREYQPDFHLTESGIYIEHFGVRRERMPDGSEKLTTAPSIDREEYLAGMEWKRQVHTTHETTLIETFSYEREEGRLLTGLEEKLAPYVTLNPRPITTIYDRIVEMGQVDDFSRLLGTFLRKFKGGGYSLQHCEDKSNQMNLGNRARAFLKVFAPVFEEYQNQLDADGRIDFEDMILRAARHVETGRYASPFRHILVDEFQDISQSRARLLKALMAQHSDCRIFAVGDDWQSIFRFAGSDIHLMRNFGRGFGGSFDGETGIHRTVDLGRTFRSVDQIAYAARTFVLRNPAQIEKQIIPAGTATEPAIRIVPVARGADSVELFGILATRAAAVAPKSKPATVLLLGRYRHIEPKMRELKKSFPRLSISFKTIHASKGLEADHVILLNADSGRLGFPSEIVDDPLLSMVSPEEEAFQNAEERRVMYVAMTRARHTLTILTSNRHPSAFVTELQKDRAYGIAASPKSGPEPHECGECGGRLLGTTGKDGRIWYHCEHTQHCGNLMPACAECGTALPRRRGGRDAGLSRKQADGSPPPHADGRKDNDTAGRQVEIFSRRKAERNVTIERKQGVGNSPRRRNKGKEEKKPPEVQCDCGASYPACPGCKDGWLVERTGRYGQFFGCARYPLCNGKARKTGSRRKASAARR